MPVQVIEAVAAVTLLGTDAVAVGARLTIPCESEPDTESSPSLTVTSQVTVAPGSTAPARSNVEPVSPVDHV